MTISRETLFGMWSVGFETMFEGLEFGRELWSKNARVEGAGITGTCGNMGQNSSVIVRSIIIVIILSVISNVIVRVSTLSNGITSIRMIDIIITKTKAG